MAQEYEFVNPMKTKSEIMEYADGYKEHEWDEKIDKTLKKAFQRGYMEKCDLMETAEWKSKRAKSRADKNSEADVREISQISFSAESEMLRIGVLRILHGVEWPMASVILHFAFDNLYPILDIRAMNTVNNGKQNYNHEMWKKYCEFCRNEIAKHEISMRDLDRALWQYDKENN